MGKLEELKARINWDNFSGFGKVNAYIPKAHRCDTSGHCGEVVAVAVDRDNDGKVVRALIWDGMANPCESITTVDSANDADFYGIKDHGYHA